MIGEVARVSGHDETAAAGRSRGRQLLATFLELLMDGLAAVGITAGGSGKLFMVGDERLGQRNVEVAKDMENLKQDVLAAGGNSDVFSVAG